MDFLNAQSFPGLDNDQRLFKFFTKVNLESVEGHCLAVQRLLRGDRSV
jgi:hypothetical protein